MLKKNNKFISIIAILIIAILCSYLLAFSTDKGKIEKDGITAKYNVTGSRIIVKISGDIPEEFTWNYTDSESTSINDIVVKPYKKTGLAANIILKSPSNYAFNFYCQLNNDSLIYADVSMYCSLDESNIIHINNFDISIYRNDSKDRIDIKNEMDSKQNEFINMIRTVTPSFKIIDGVNIKSLQTLEKRKDGSFIGGSDLAQYTFDYEGYEYDGILSEKIKFGTMLKDLTKHMKELDCEKKVFDINGIEVKGYDYHNDDKIYSVCYFVFGETRCFISSNEANFEETRALAQKIIENQ